MSKSLSEHEINEIIGLHQSGFSNAEIQEKTGRSDFVIRKYIRQNTEIKKCPKCGQVCSPPSTLLFHLRNKDSDRAREGHRTALLHQRLLRPRPGKCQRQIYERRKYCYSLSGGLG